MSVGQWISLRQAMQVVALLEMMEQRGEGERDGGRQS